MLKSSLCDYSDAYILKCGTVSVINIEHQGADANNNKEKVALKNCASFTDCICKINRAKVDNAKDIDVIMLMYNSL